MKNNDSTHGPTPTPESIARGMLFAAAPDLLDACIAALSLNDEYHVYKWDRVMTQLGDAIFKATGKRPKVILAGKYPRK